MKMQNNVPKTIADVDRKLFFGEIASNVGDFLVEKQENLILKDYKIMSKEEIKLL